MHRYSPAEAAILSRHVSNLDRNVYCIFDLPEEVVAVVFARVSRSPHSFRDNLLSLIQDQQLAVVGNAAAGPGRQFDLDAARKFHERVVIGYGHSSVAELAVAHVGVEKISRLASARLELANPFISFIEYSQRYQRPERGDYYTPPELQAHPNLLARYRKLQDTCYDRFEQLISGLVPYLRTVIPRREAESEKAWTTRVEKTAFEDARYALTLAMHTNLGLTANGRALRDAIARLASDPYPECAALADALREEVTSVLPVLLRHAEPNPYLIETRRALEAALSLFAAPARGGAGPLPAAVRLTEYTGQGAPDPEAAALHQVLEGMLTTHTHLDADGVAQTADTLGRAGMAALYRELVQRLGPHDNPMDPTHRVHYGAAFEVSEACWHQLLRHCRRIEFAPAEPGVDLGWVVPPNIEAAGLIAVLQEAVTACEQLYLDLHKAVPRVAPYVVTNAHRRRALARFDLWELYHLVNLRGSADAQWEIRQAVLDLRDQIGKVHPVLVPKPRRAT